MTKEAPPILVHRPSKSPTGFSWKTSRARYHRPGPSRSRARSAIGDAGGGAFACIALAAASCGDPEASPRGSQRVPHRPDFRENTMTTTSKSVRRSATLAIGGGILGLGLAALPVHGADTMNIRINRSPCPTVSRCSCTRTTRFRRHREHVVPRRLGRRGAGTHGLRASVRAHHVHGLAARRQPASSTSCSRPRAPITTARPRATARTTTRTARPMRCQLMLWLDSDRMGYLLPEIDNGEGRPPARRREERAPPALRERAVRARAGEHPEPALSRRGIRTTGPTIGSMTDLSAASIDDVQQLLQDVLHAEQRDDGASRAT